LILRGAILAMTAQVCALAQPAAASDLDARLAAANMKRGQLLYMVCKACHDVEAGLPHKVGPNLHGMFGRRAGTAEGFKYTDALVKSGLVWTPETMDEWLRQPGALVPGNGMAFAGIANDADRASLIAWLLANSGAN
jgi:cytochrome c